MRKLVVIFLALSIIITDTRSIRYNGSPFGYHMKVGVPKALKLLQYEGLHTRIIGGSQVEAASAIPYQAGIIARLTTGHESVCGGSLISNTRILTAAHCWWDGHSQANQFTIVLGSVTIFTGGTRVDTKDVVVHPRWNDVDITHDIMVAKIARVAYDNNINAIPLPTGDNANLAGLAGTISGYGKTSDAAYTSEQLASSPTRSANSLKQVKLDDSHLCTSGEGNVGTCDGDSGGPLTAMVNNKRTLVGIVSFGLDEGCSFGNPSVYTRLTAFSAWISANM